MSFLGWLAQPAVLPWVALVFGLCIGSFLNVVAHRLPKMLERQWRNELLEFEGKQAPKEAPYNLFVPRSACPSCGHRIKALENVPVLSFVFLKGRCSNCRAKISPRYPVVEALAGIAAAYSAARYGFSLAALGAAVFCWTMIALTAIDLDTQLLPDDLTLSLLWLGLLLNLGNTFAPLASAVVGAAAGYLSLWSVYWAFKLVTGKEGMGYGDFKLLGAIGAWLGWQMLPLVIMLSAVVGAVVGLSLIAFTRHGRDQPIPFGPYLAGAGVIALFWGGAISRRYLPLLG